MQRGTQRGVTIETPMVHSRHLRKSSHTGPWRGATKAGASFLARGACIPGNGDDVAEPFHSSIWRTSPLSKGLVGVRTGDSSADNAAYPLAYVAQGLLGVAVSPL